MNRSPGMATCRQLLLVEEDARRPLKLVVDGVGLTQDETQSCSRHHNVPEDDGGIVKQGQDAQ